MKKIKVKDLEVKVLDKVLQFTNEGQEIELERKLGQSDYRIVYNYLKLKNPDKEKGTYKVGNFTYTIDDDNFVNINSTNFNFDKAFELTDLDNKKNPHQYVRNQVINYIISTIE